MQRFLSELSEDEQVAMALRISMQYRKMNERNSRIPIVTATDARRPSLQMQSEEVSIIFCRDPHFFSAFTIDCVKYA